MSLHLEKRTTSSRARKSMDRRIMSSLIRLSSYSTGFGPWPGVTLGIATLLQREGISARVAKLVHESAPPLFNPGVKVDVQGSNYIGVEVLGEGEQSAAHHRTYDLNIPGIGARFDVAEESLSVTTKLGTKYLQKHQRGGNSEPSDTNYSNFGGAESSLLERKRKRGFPLNVNHDGSSYGIASSTRLTSLVEVKDVNTNSHHEIPTYQLSPNNIDLEAHKAKPDEEIREDNSSSPAEVQDETASATGSSSTPEAKNAAIQKSAQEPQPSAQDDKTSYDSNSDTDNDNKDDKDDDDKSSDTDNDDDALNKKHILSKTGGKSKAKIDPDRMRDILKEQQQYAEEAQAKKQKMEQRAMKEKMEEARRIQQEQQAEKNRDEEIEEGHQRRNKLKKLKKLKHSRKEAAQDEDSARDPDIGSGYGNGNNDGVSKKKMSDESGEETANGDANNGNDGVGTRSQVESEKENEKSSGDNDADSEDKGGDDVNNDIDADETVGKPVKHKSHVHKQKMAHSHKEKKEEKPAKEGEKEESSSDTDQKDQQEDKQQDKEDTDSDSSNSTKSQKSQSNDDSDEKGHEQEEGSPPAPSALGSDVEVGADGSVKVRGESPEEHNHEHNHSRWLSRHEDVREASARPSSSDSPVSLLSEKTRELADTAKDVLDAVGFQNSASPATADQDDGSSGAVLRKHDRD